MGLKFLQLIRSKNLILVALTQIAIQYLLFVPYFQQAGLSPTLNIVQFGLLVFTTVLIAAGGYIINDIIDYPIDLVNKPEKIFVEKYFSIRTAYIAYFGSILLGLVISIYLAIVTQNLPLLSLYPTAVLLMFLYSKYFKQRVLVGNVIVALFCAFVAGIIWVAERNSLQQLDMVQRENAIYLRYILFLYLVFAFLSTMYREVIKDIEDRAGDLQYGCRTLPIVAGVKVAKWVAFLFGILLFLMLLHTAHVQWTMEHWYSFGFLIVAIQLPLLYSFSQLLKANTSKEFHHLSTVAKFIMLTGLILLFLM